MAAGLEVSSQAVSCCIDLLLDLLLVWRPQPYLTNVGRRLIKSLKVYICDGAPLHALLNITPYDAVLGHLVVGAIWEVLAIGNPINAAPAPSVPSFYRTSGGAEIDVVLDRPGGFGAGNGLTRCPVGAKVKAISLQELADVLSTVNWCKFLDKIRPWRSEYGRN